MYLKQTFLFKKKEKYKEYGKKIVDKFNLKHRYITNLSGAKKIANYIHKNQHWIIHNSNGGLPGSVQKIINEKKSTYCSFEYEESKSVFREFKIGQSTNSEILELNTTAKTKDYINNNLNNELCIEYGKKKLKSLYEKNYSKDEINNFYKKYPELKNFDKNKIFLFLSNSLVDSRFYNHSSHTIFDNIDESNTNRTLEAKDIILSDIINNLKNILESLDLAQRQALFKRIDKTTNPKAPLLVPGLLNDYDKPINTFINLLENNVVVYFDTIIPKLLTSWLSIIENIFKYIINYYRMLETTKQLN
jgi:hypothetical protein